jgi:hypothetical protein
LTSDPIAAALHLQRYRLIPIIFLALYGILSTLTVVYPAPKRLFPGLDEKDLHYYLQTLDHTPDPNIYLITSLSLLNLQPFSAVFDISKHPPRYLLPLITLPLYPDLPVHIQSEFFDFTVWGQLGNDFNSSFELIELESYISSLFAELESLNKRFQELVSSHLLPGLQFHRLVTFHKSTFFDMKSSLAHPAIPPNRSPHHSPQTSDHPSDPLNLIYMYETHIQSARLKVSLDSPPRKRRLLAKGSYGPDFTHSVDTTRNLPPSPPEIDSFLYRFVNNIAPLLHYLKDNTFESLIYLWCLLILVISVKVLFLN